MSGLDVVFELNNPLVRRTHVFNLFYRAGLGSESNIFCLMVLCVWWAACTLLVALILLARFKTSILRRAALQRNGELPSAACELRAPDDQLRQRLSSPAALRRDAAVVLTDDGACDGGFAPDVARQKRAGHASRRLARRLEESFARVAKDGHMGVVEFGVYLGVHVGHTPPDDVVSRLFRAVDTCDTGRVPFREFRRFIDVHTHLQPEAVAQAFFRVYDPRDTDRIDEGQLAAGLADVLVPPPDAAAVRHAQPRAKAAALMAFVDVARRGAFDVQDLEAACRGNLTFLQYCATLC